MDTQNTPVHLKLWHREFWMLALANLMLMMSAYGLLPTLPFYLLGRGLDGMQTGLVMGIYGAGLFALGGFCSYYVQRYRRNHVCQYSILGLVLCMGMAYYLEFVPTYLSSSSCCVACRKLHSRLLSIAVLGSMSLGSPQ